MKDKITKMERNICYTIHAPLQVCTESYHTADAVQYVDSTEKDKTTAKNIKNAKNVINNFKYDLYQAVSNTWPAGPIYCNYCKMWAWLATYLLTYALSPCLLYTSPSPRD